MAEVTSEQTMVTLSDVMFKKLLSFITSDAKKASLVNFNHYYSGEKQKEVLEAFLSALNVYKRLENIDDKDVLYGMPLLLRSDAAIWWQGVKDNVGTWTEFETQIREAFVPNKPAYVLYQEIMSEPQQSQEKTDIFIAKKQMLFAQLPSPGLTECVQLDMIYGLLRPDICSSVPRSSFDSFKGLLEGARAVERNLLEEYQGTSQNTKHRKLRCSDCRNKVTKKPKLTRVSPQQGRQLDFMTIPPSNPQPKFSCYGCGAPGFTRSNCPACKGKSKVPNTENISFW